MDIKVEKVDDINYIISGTVPNSIIEQKAAQLKAEAQAEAAKAPEGDAPAVEVPADEKLEQAAAGQVFQMFVEAGIKKAEIPLENLLGQPGLKKYERQADSVFFEVDIATSPKIDTDIDYTDIVPEYTKPKADPALVEERMADYAVKQAPFTPLETPKAVEEGDVAVIDFEGFVDGVAFEGGKAEKFNLKIGSKSFIPGFEEQLIGMEYGEDRTIKVNFPEDYSAKDLAGKETEFKIHLHEIHEQKPMTVNDEFAQKVLQDPKATVELLREKLGDQIVAQEIGTLYETELKPKLIEGLLPKFDFSLPNNIVEQEIDAKVREQIQHLSQEEQQSYLEDKEKFNTLRDSVREEARKGIKIAMIIEAMAEKEGISVDEQEVLAALGHHAMMTGQNPQELVKYYQDNNLMPSAKLGLTEDKLFGKMLGFDK